MYLKVNTIRSSRIAAASQREQNGSEQDRDFCFSLHRYGRGNTFVDSAAFHNEPDNSAS